MKYNDIVAILAPCGLNCQKCVGFGDGEIRKHSQKLIELLGSFDTYAERFSTFMSIYKNYPLFQEQLQFFANAGCKGCRKGTCGYPNCGVVDCCNNKGIAFCFECNEFPCEKSNFDEHLKMRWIKMNIRMKEIGVEAYYHETKDESRYT